MKTRIGTLFLLLVPALCFANALTTLTLREAVKQKLVSVSTKGKGGYTGDVLKSNVRNLGAQNLSIMLEAGLRFHPDDASMQDILVTGAQQFALGANQETELNICGMCCISANSSPSEGMNFTLLGLADTSLVRVAKYVDAQKLYTSGDAQHAVWVVSDNIRPESIDFMNPVNEGLVELVTEIKDIAKPSYVISYVKDPARPFTGDAASVKGTFKCLVKKQGELVMAIFDSQGNASERSVFDGPPMPGMYHFGFEFNVYNFPSGTYYARVMMGTKTLAEVKIII